MNEQEKYQKLKTIAMKIADAKKSIEQKGVEKATIENGIRFVVPQSLLH